MAELEKKMTKASFQASQSFLVQHFPCEHPSHSVVFHSTAELGTTGFFKTLRTRNVLSSFFLFSLKTR